LVKNPGAPASGFFLRARLFSLLLLSILQIVGIFLHRKLIFAQLLLTSYQ